MRKITLLSTTDIHGTLSTFSYLDQSIKPQGLSRYSNVVKQFKKKNECIVVDNGDSLQGSPLLTYAHRIKAKPNPLALVFNKIGLNYYNLGNHDFNYGEEILLNYMDDLNAECLTSNILYKDSPIGQTRIHVLNDIKIAFIGLCTDYIPHWEKPEHIKNFMFLDPIESLKIELSKLVNVDYTIVYYHGGLEKDPQSGLTTEVLTGENVGYALSQIPGIDLLITGHQHRSLSTIINNTPVMQCALNASEFMLAEINCDSHTISHALQSMSNYDYDPEIESLIKPFDDETQIWLDQKLGRIEGNDFLIHDPFDARVHKHPYVSFINHVQKEVTQADISGTALFNQALGLGPEISYRDLVNNYVYPNSLIVKQMSGKSLRAYLEQCADYFMVKDGKISVNPLFDEPKPQHFNYDMLDGLDYTLKISNPIGKRVIELKYQGKDIQDEDSFTVAMNNYRASGGGNFHMIPPCPTVLEIQRDMTDILAEYIQNKKIVTITHHDNIKVII
jgi:2',3'-cyclic-nucleotide 2'-phosphodiesterase / 3'-nucleotidase